MLIRLTLVTTAAIVGGMALFGTGDGVDRAEPVAETVLTPASAPPETAQTADAAQPQPETAQPETARPETAEVEVAKQGGLDVTGVLPASMSIDVEAAVATAIEETPEIAPVRVAAPAAPATDLRTVYVTGTRVNLRAGPSTDNAVVDQLVQGTEAEVLGEAADGWLHIRAVASGIEGYMSGDFLSEERPG